MPTKKTPKKSSKSKKFSKKAVKKAFKKVISKSKKKPLPKSLRDPAPLPLDTHRIGSAPAKTAVLDKPSTEIEAKRPPDGVQSGIPNTPHPMVEVRKLTIPPLPEHIVKMLGVEQSAAVVQRTQEIVDGLLATGIDPRNIRLIASAPTLIDEAEAIEAELEAAAKAEQKAADPSALETPYAKAVLQMAKQYDDAGNYGGTFVDRIKEGLAIEMAVMPDDMRQMIEGLFNLR